ncbi:M48 family metallopeptidase [Candidatus Endomicrobiellum agilis]|uniref:M48 family metallopeptidase n=1 Tax=Candidatus Endomicrobiellum agilis TaxID=3238957 RepID=UPI0035802101|nr:M48 family metallopeptidase [Endomicrobium sp.]
MANITTYDFISSNSRRTVWLMILFPISLAAIIYLIILLASVFVTADKSQIYNRISAIATANQTVFHILPVISVTAILWILVSYYAGQIFILSAVSAVELTKKNAPEVIRTVENIAIAAGLPMPKVYAIDDEALNAFATGRDPEHSYIVLTKGIINKLKKPELEGVIAHEMSHIGNRDIRLMLIMIVCISFATVVAELLLRFALTAKTRNSKNNNNAVVQIFSLALATAFYIYGYLVAPLIKLAVSRTRELQADATAALITRNPQGLIDALKKISDNSIVKNLSDKQTISSICIANPLAKNKQNSFFSKISGLFATHPPIEDRIKALQAMDGYR